MSAVKKSLFPLEKPTPTKRPRYFMSPRFTPNVSSNSMPGLKKLTEMKEAILKHTLEELKTGEDIELFLVAKCGLNNAMLIFQSLNHVPVGFPQRLEYVSNILVAGGLIKYFQSIDELNQCIKYINDTCDVRKFDSRVSDEVLWKATNMFKTAHMGFIMSKADSCLEKGCSGKLYGRQKDTIQVIVYTLNGPVPYLKTTLACRKCGAR